MMGGVPETASTNWPLMKSLVNLTSGTSKGGAPLFFSASTSAAGRSAPPPPFTSLPIARRALLACSGDWGALAATRGEEDEDRPRVL